MFEIHGGNLDSLSFYDGGPSYHLEDCQNIEEARKAVSEWHEKNYAAWIVNKETQKIEH